MIQKVFGTKSGNAVFTCPECGETRHMDVSRYRDIKKAVKLKYTCKCKHSFSVLLERRQSIRKEVVLEGALLINQSKYAFDIVDLSRYGLKVKLKEPVDLKPSERVTIEFILDDATSSLVSKEVIIRSTKDREMGMEFVSSDHYDKLGPYLLFHLD